jgi:uncharacterized protein (DUF58 family)
MSLISKEVFKNIRRIQIYTNRTVNDVMAGAYHSAFKGQGMEFEDVREYIPGDDVRTIDWNVTARMNHPFVKRYREERELTVSLVIDVSASSKFGSGKRLKSELIAEIAAVLAFSAIKNNDKVGLLLFTDQVELYLPPQKGVRHVLRVIRELLAFKPQSKGTDIGHALSFLAKVQKKQGVCFLLSDFISKKDYSKEIAMTAKRHDLITMAINDPYEMNFPGISLIDLCDLESNEFATIEGSSKAVQDYFQKHSKERLERHKNLMNKIGAGFIALENKDSYATALQRFFKIRQQRR